MEQFFLEVAKVSPIMAVIGFMYYKQGLNYKGLVDRVQDENSKREDKYQNTIDKNQNIIQSLAENLNVVEDVKKDVEEIKTYIRK